MNVRRLVLPALSILFLPVLSGCGRDRAKAVETVEPRATSQSGTARTSRPASSAPSTSSILTEPAPAPSTVSGPRDSASPSVPVISGRVRRPDGRPVPDALISALPFNLFELRPSGSVIASTTSSATGAYRLEVQGADVVAVRAGRPGYVAVIQSMLLRRLNTNKIICDFILQEAVSIRGQVVGPEGQPVERAVVRFVPRWNFASDLPAPDSTETSTTVDGSFVLEGLPEGEAMLAVTADRYAAATAIVRAPADNALIRLAAGGGQVEGAVYDYHTREGVAGATVTLTLKDGELPFPGFELFRATTDPYGAFRLENLPAGTYIINARTAKLNLIPSGSRQSHVLSLCEGESTTGLNLFLYPGHTVTGVVRDRRTSEPLAGVRVRQVMPDGADRPETAVETDSLGRYRLTGIFDLPDHTGNRPGAAGHSRPSPGGQTWLRREHGRGGWAF